MTPIPDYVYFLEELDAAIPGWQRKCGSMLAAARTARLEGMYWAWLSQTQEGLQRRIALAGIADATGAELASRDSLERFRAESRLEGDIEQEDDEP